MFCTKSQPPGSQSESVKFVFFPRWYILGRHLNLWLIQLITLIFPFHSIRFRPPFYLLRDAASHYIQDESPCPRKICWGNGQAPAKETPQGHYFSQQSLWDLFWMWTFPFSSQSFFPDILISEHTSTDSSLNKIRPIAFAVTLQSISNFLFDCPRFNNHRHSFVHFRPPPCRPQRSAPVKKWHVIIYMYYCIDFSFVCSTTCSIACTVT